MGKIINIILCILLLAVLVVSTNYEYKYNPYSGERDRTITSNQSDWNLTVSSIQGNLSWTNLTDYPASCPAYSAITQLDDAVTCTDSWVNSAGDNMTGDLNINGNLNVTNNITGNFIYGGMWHHNNTGTTLSFAVQDTWYNLFFNNATDLNGFTYVGGLGVSSNLTAQVSGKYRASYMAMGSGQNNHIYLTTILIDGVEKPECSNQHKMSAGGDVITQNGICIITINSGQNIEVAIQDLGGTGDGVYYGGNLNLVRIGN